MRRIELIIQPDGVTRLETSGFAGGECRDASRVLEQALGQRTSEQLTAEFYANQAQPQRLEARQ